IVAYLRAQPPVKHAVPKSEYRIKLPTSYGPEVKKVSAPSRKDPVKYGAYLAGPLGHCMDCHTPRAKGVPDLKKAGAGGNPLPGPWGVAVSRNLTPHETGDKGWSDAAIARAFRERAGEDDVTMQRP